MKYTLMTELEAEKFLSPQLGFENCPAWIKAGFRDGSLFYRENAKGERELAVHTYFGVIPCLNGDYLVKNEDEGGFDVYNGKIFEEQIVDNEADF